VRRIRYHQIAEELRHGINTGRYRPGDVLPSEAALVAAHGASRVTVRKALEVLRTDGLVESRQGFGWTVAAESLRQRLESLTTIEDELAASGRCSERRVLDYHFVDAPPPVAEVLGDRVLEVRRVNLADGVPFARVTVWCREDLARPLSAEAVARSSFHELLTERPGGATQAIGAGLIAPDDAAVLGVPPATAVLVVRRVTHAAGGQPLLVSEHVFPGHLTEFVVDLPWVDDEAASPRGLRLMAEDRPELQPDPERSSCRYEEARQAQEARR
jgi:GntR family transcriptional regulator